jgi:RND family efflux transporter MFP subunit
MGGAVAPQIPLLNIADIGQIKVVVNIVEKDIPKIRNGQAAKITVDSYPDVSFYGKVATINQALDRMTRTVAVQIVVDNEKHLLKPGMFAKVKLYVLSKRNVMVVPVESVMETAGGGSYVFVVEGDKAVKKPVEAGISDEAKTEIKSGLKDRDLVVIAGQSKLSENSEVKIIQ